MLKLQHLATIGLAAAAAIAMAQSAQAGGFSHGSGGHGLSSFVVADAKAKAHVKAKTDHFDYMHANYANTSAGVVGPWFAEGKSSAGHDTMFTAHGKVSYKERNKSKVKVYAKGGNIMAKARSESYVKIYVDGKIYLVSESEVAAMSRFTPLGTRSMAIAKNSVGLYVNGSVSYANGARTSASVRTKR
ncbi:MAG: hypothetical protein V3V97_10610 [Hyphomicrobiaceae bacterium]